MDTTFTEYHFVKVRKAFEARLLDRVSRATSDELCSCYVFDFSIQAAALIVKYVCEKPELFPPDTLQRLLEIEPEDLATIVGAYCAVSLAEGSDSDDQDSPESEDEYGVALLELLDEDIAPWEEMASRAPDRASQIDEAVRRFQQRADKCLSIPPDWWQDNPDVGIWRSILLTIFGALIECAKIVLKFQRLARAASGTTRIFEPPRIHN